MPETASRQQQSEGRAAAAFRQSADQAAQIIERLEFDLQYWRARASHEKARADALAARLEALGAAPN